MPFSRKTDIHIVGEANTTFLCQIAFFCRALRRLYKGSNFLRVRCFLAGVPINWKSLAPHIAECRQDIEIMYFDSTKSAERGMYGQCDAAFLNIKNDAELVVFADADTFWYQRPDALLETVLLNRAVAGCIAHYPPPDAHESQHAYWETLFEEYVGQPPSFDHAYSLKPNLTAPFYVNFGFVAMPAKIMKRNSALYIDIATRLRQQMNYPYFSYQIALTLWAAKLKINTISVPFHYNFPNDDAVFKFADLDEQDVVVFHYLRENSFSRGELFAGAEAFQHFLTAKKGRADELLAEVWQTAFNVAEWIR